MNLHNGINQAFEFCEFFLFFESLKTKNLKNIFNIDLIILKIKLTPEYLYPKINYMIILAAEISI